MFTASPEIFLVILAVAMCSILLMFTIGVVLIFHCCQVKDVPFTEVPAAVFERTRHSIAWARNSIFGGNSHSDVTWEDIEDRYLKPPPPCAKVHKAHPPTMV